MEELIKKCARRWTEYCSPGRGLPCPRRLRSPVGIPSMKLDRKSLTRRLEQFAGPEFSEDVRRQLIATRNKLSIFFSPDYQARDHRGRVRPGLLQQILQALDTDRQEQMP